MSQSNVLSIVLGQPGADVLRKRLDILLSEDVGKDTSGSLTEKEIEDLNGWIKYFDEKYERCGVIIE